tara:strand:+ start:307 stop:462 length:156 start_codon:yes stop_codon:yes gene_type:complete
MTQEGSKVLQDTSNLSGTPKKSPGKDEVTPGKQFLEEIRYFGGNEYQKIFF